MEPKDKIKTRLQEELASCKSMEKETPSESDKRAWRSKAYGIETAMRIMEEEL